MRRPPARPPQPTTTPADDDVLGHLARRLDRLAVDVVLLPPHAVTQVQVEVDHLERLIDELTTQHHDPDTGASA